MERKKTKAEVREEKRLKQKYAPKGATFAGQINKLKINKFYNKKRKGLNKVHHP